MFTGATILSQKVTIVNEVSQDDIENIVDLISNPEKRNELPILGSGAFGVVYHVTGVNGTEYAVKFTKEVVYEERSDEDDYLHDAHYLEELQGADCFPKLFFYCDGEFEIDKKKYEYLIMVTPKVNGFTLSEVSGSIQRKKEFALAMSNILIDKLKESLTYALKKGLNPSDLHQGNIMFNVDNGITVIVDVGNFRLKRNGHRHADSFENNGVANACVNEAERLVRESQRYIIEKGA